MNHDWKARAEAAEAESARLASVVAQVEALADEWGIRYVKANRPTRIATTRAMADYAQGRADTWQETEREVRAAVEGGED